MAEPTLEAAKGREGLSTSLGRPHPPQSEPLDPHGGGCDPIPMSAAPAQRKAAMQAVRERLEAAGRPVCRLPGVNRKLVSDQVQSQR